MQKYKLSFTKRKVMRNKAIPLEFFDDYQCGERGSKIEVTRIPLNFDNQVD